MPRVVAHVINQLLGVPADLVGGRIDEDIRILHKQRQHLAKPRHTYVATDDAEFGKFDRDTIQIGDGPTGLRFSKWPGMSDLRAEWNVEFAALRK